MDISGISTSAFPAPVLGTLSEGKTQSTVITDMIITIIAKEWVVVDVP